MQRNSNLALQCTLTLLALLPLAACGGGGGGGSAAVEAPRKLSYPSAFELYMRGFAVPPLTPTVSGGTVETWSVTPALPAGMSLSALDGSISGTAAALAAPATYTVRAANSAGFAEASLELGVVPPPRFVVAGNSLDDTLSTFQVHASSGLLTPTGYSVPSSGADFPRGMAVHPSGLYLYVANRGSQSISIYDLIPATGQLVERGALPTAGGNPNELVLHPAGDVLYAIARTSAHIETFAVAPDGALSSLGTLSLSNGAETAELSADARFLWVANVNNHTLRTLAIDPLTHLPSDTGASVTASNQPNSLASSRDGRFVYASCLTGNRIDSFSVDPQSGALTRVQSLLTGALPAHVAIAPSGRFLYSAISSDDTLRTYSIDPQTGLLTQIATTPSGDRPASIAFDPSGSFLYCTELNTSEVDVFGVDRATGTLLRKDSVRTREQPVFLSVVSGNSQIEPETLLAFVTQSAANDPAVYGVNPASGELDELAPPAPTGGQPQVSVTHPSLRWLLCARTSDDELVVYSIDANAGGLSRHGPGVPAGDEPIALAVEPSGRFVYALARGSDELRSYSFDAQTGALAFQGSLPTSGDPSSLAIDPSGRFAIVADPVASTLTVHAIDFSTGAPIPPAQPTQVAGGPQVVSVLPNGRYLLAALAGTGRLALFSIEPADGSLAQVSSRPSGLDPASIAADPVGRFVYVCNRGSAPNGDVTIFRVDPNASITGVLTRVAEATAGVHPVSCVVDPAGKYLYVANATSNDVTRFVINPASGRLSNALLTPVGAGATSIALFSTLDGSIP